MNQPDPKAMWEETMRQRHYKEEKEKREGTYNPHPPTWESDCCNAKIVTAGHKVVCLKCGQECT